MVNCRIGGNLMNKSNIKVPLWQKYALSVQEASAYFGIGENKIRKIIAEHPDETFYMEVGTHVKIKREVFAKYLDNITSL